MSALNFGGKEPNTAPLYVSCCNSGRTHIVLARIPRPFVERARQDIRKQVFSAVRLENGKRTPNKNLRGRGGQKRRGRAPTTLSYDPLFQACSKSARNLHDSSIGWYTTKRFPGPEVAASITTLVRANIQELLKYRFCAFAKLREESVFALSPFPNLPKYATSRRWPLCSLFDIVEVIRRRLIS